MEASQGKLLSVLSRILVIQLVLAPGGCVQQEAARESPVELPAQFSGGGEARVAGVWWESFGSEELNRVVEDALRDNLDLRAAWQRLREAQAVADRASADLWPQLEATAGAEMRRPEFDGGDRLRLGLSADYELDLWGRIEARSEAERFRFEATRADYEAAGLSLSAEVARSWFQLTVIGQQLDLLQEQVSTNAKVLELLRNRFGSGQIRRVDVLRQEQLLEETRARLANEQARQQVVRHQLAVLLGRSAREPLPDRGQYLPELPPLPATGLPAELLQRRPDVRSAYAGLMAADRDLAAAVVNRYPRLSLRASLETLEDDATVLFDEWVRNLAASLVAPLIDGGRRRAENIRREALLEEQLMAYGQTLLAATAEVEDALVQEQRQQERLRHIEAQARLAGEAYNQLREEYINGMSPYLDVLTSLTDEQRLKRELLEARLSLYEFRIALYRALAGAVPQTLPETE
ncbi:MAG TPA: efflux transporter outer membrane subunit [Oceanipulchritudo sp.]|nr:efflux transporter outer membrane subunit [Oceanipulchritudo sp.]